MLLLPTQSESILMLYEGGALASVEGKLVGIEADPSYYHVLRATLLQTGVRTQILRSLFRNSTLPSSSVDILASYTAITRVRTRKDLLIFRPFDLAPLQRGPPRGPDVLLRILRGEKKKLGEEIKEKSCMFSGLQEFQNF